MSSHRRTGQHPFGGGADRVLPEWIRWGGGGSSRNFPGSRFSGGGGSSRHFRDSVGGGSGTICFPLTAVTDTQFVLFKHVLCFARIISTLCPNVCRQTAKHSQLRRTMYRSMPQLEDAHLLCSQHVPQNASRHLQPLRRLVQPCEEPSLPPFQHNRLHERERVEPPVQALPPCLATCVILRLLLCVPRGPQE